MESGPGDLNIFISLSFLSIASFEISNFNSVFISGLFDNSHTPSSSLVKTLEKNVAKDSAFSSSVLAILFGSQLSSMYKSGILFFALVLLDTYIQNFLAEFSHS